MNSSSKTILVVDDFQNIANVVKTTLELKGYQAITATSGEQALDILANPAYKVDLIVSDYNMPDMNGLELLKKVRSTDEFIGLPFIMLTTEKDTEKMKEAKRARLNAWIRKPYKLQNFIDQIDYCLRRNERAIV